MNEFNVEEQRAHIEQMQAETRKFAAEQHKLAAEAAKYERETRWFPLLQLALGLATLVAVLLTRH